MTGTWLGKPSIPHTTLLLFMVQPWSHTCRQWPSYRTSTTPSITGLCRLALARTGLSRTSSSRRPCSVHSHHGPCPQCLVGRCRSSSGKALAQSSYRAPGSRTAKAWNPSPREQKAFTKAHRVSRGQNLFVQAFCLISLLNWRERGRSVPSLPSGQELSGFESLLLDVGGPSSWHPGDS